MFQIAVAYVIIMELHRIYVDQLVRKRLNTVGEGKYPTVTFKLHVHM